MTQRPRIMDVAEEAGVSTGTVSRVMNGDQTVGTARREAVLAAIKKLRYQPHPIARAMRSGSTRTIGITVRTLRNHSVATFVETVLECVAPEGYAVSVSDTVMRRRFEETSVQDFLNRHYDGVITLSPYSLRTYERAHTAGAQVVAVYSPAGKRRSAIDSIELDYGPPAAALFEELFQLGHRRLKFIAPSAAYRLNPLASTPRVASGAMTVEHLPDRVPNGDESDLALAQHVLGGEASALLLRTESAPHMLKALRAVGLRVPEDVSVALWGQAPWRELVEPRLAAVEIDHRALGVAAARRLLARIHSRPFEVIPPFVGKYAAADSLAAPGDLREFWRR